MLILCSLSETSVDSSNFKTSSCSYVSAYSFADFCPAASIESTVSVGSTTSTESISSAGLAVSTESAISVVLSALVELTLIAESVGGIIWLNSISSRSSLVIGFGSASSCSVSFPKSIISISFFCPKNIESSISFMFVTLLISSTGILSAIAFLLYSISDSDFVELM